MLAGMYLRSSGRNMRSRNVIKENAMNYFTLLQKRRSVRKYEETPVPLEIIQELIAESTLAPSAGNEQPWEFTVIRDTGLMRRISDESKKNILARINADPEDSASKYRGMLENESFNVFYNAPCLLMVAGDAQRRNLIADCSLAACYLMMGAAARGLGTCWINLGAEIYDLELRNELGLAEDRQIVAPIILGYPAAVPCVPKRNEPAITVVGK